MHITNVGYSNTGYYGTYGTAITNDGQIVADFIKTGTLIADLIKTGTIRNKNGTLEIDLDGQGIDFKSGGEKAVSINGAMVEFYDWQGTTRKTRVGNIYSSRSNNDPNKCGISYAHRENAYLSIGYYDEVLENYYPYIRFDKDKLVNPEQKEDITFYKTPRIEFMYMGNSVLTKDSVGGFQINTPNYTLYVGGIATMFYDSKTDSMWGNKDFNFSKNLHVNGNFTVSGNKNCIQDTENYGQVAYYSVEDTESYLTDTCNKVIKVDLDKTKKIFFDKIYKESVNLEIDYIVQIYKYGFGDYRIKEQTKDYFIIESDRNDFEFKYTVKAKRRGFENIRLEKFNKNESEVLENATFNTEFRYES